MNSMLTFDIAMKHRRWPPLTPPLSRLALAACLSSVCLAAVHAAETKQSPAPPPKQAPHPVLASPHPQAGPPPQQLRLPNSRNYPVAPHRAIPPETRGPGTGLPPRQVPPANRWPVGGRYAAPIAQRISQCGASPRVAGCAIWGRFQAKADWSRLNESRSRIFASSSGSTVTTWVGSDGAVRRVAMIATPPQTMTVTFIAAAAIPIGAAVQAPAAVPAAPPLAPSTSSPAVTPQNYTQGYPAAAPLGATSATAQTAGESDLNAASAAVIPPRSATEVSANETLKGAAAPSDPASTASPPGSSPPSATNASNGTLPVKAVCRRVTTVATVGNDSDNATELWCRDANGDWAMATDATRFGG
jgi:hypothetical protein